MATQQTSAMIYDYNLLGKGYAYADIRNVCFSFSPKSKEAFLDTYGEYNTKELIVDEVTSIIISLYFASQKEKFPAWANALLAELHLNYEYKVRTLLELIK